MRHVQIQTTPSCNAWCTMCPHKDSRLHKAKGPMGQFVFETVLFQLSKIPLGKVVLYLQNEPFMDPYIFDRIKMTTERLKQRSHIELSTNASLLTQTRIEALLDSIHTPGGSGHRLDMLLSFPATNLKDYEKITGLDFFNSLKNIKAFLTAVDDIGYISKQIQCCEVPNPEQFWNPIFKTMGLRNPPALSKFGAISRAGNVVRDKRPVKVSGIPFYGKCPRIHQWLHIDWEGNLIACCHDYHGEAILGSLIDTDIVTLEKQMWGKMQELSKKDNFLCTRCETRG